MSTRDINCPKPGAISGRAVHSLALDVDLVGALAHGVAV
jgi:hypothetical protein